MNAWVKENKPLLDKEYIQKGKSRFYHKEYISRLFDKVGKLSELSLVHTNEVNSTTTDDTNQFTSEDLIQELREQIKFLKGQITFLQKQLEDRGDTHTQMQSLVSQQQVLSKQQNELLLGYKEVKSEDRKKILGIF